MVPVPLYPKNPSKSPLTARIRAVSQKKKERREGNVKQKEFLGKQNGKK
jgi:hypothetical protein